MAVQNAPKPMDRKCSFSPSSTVKAAPHLGHFSSVGFILISAQPKERAARRLSARNVAAKFFIPNISLGRSLMIYLRISRISKQKKPAPKLTGQGLFRRCPSKNAAVSSQANSSCLAFMKLKTCPAPGTTKSSQLFPAEKRAWHRCWAWLRGKVASFSP